MKKISLKWTWKLSSSVHQGSGLSRPGVADSLIVRDANNMPYITGDAVKGALRMSAEHILAWKGEEQRSKYEDSAEPKDPQRSEYEDSAEPKDPQRSEYKGSAEPKHPLLKAIFGGEAHAHFSPGTFIGSSTSMTMTVAQTAIEQKSGTALDNSLRIIETLGNGSISSECNVWVESEEKAVAAFMLASLLATDWIGGRTGAGLGQVQVKTVTIEAGDEKWEKTKELETLLGDNVFNINADPFNFINAEPFNKGSSSQENPNPSGQTEWKRLKITLKEPMCIGIKPSISNSFETLEFIPATTIRGACYAAWKREGWSDDTILPLLGVGYRWTPALPADSEDKVAVPIPLSWHVPKGSEGITEVHDTLSEQIPPGDEKIQWKKPQVRWISRNGEKSIKLLRESTMHSARDYFTGSKKKGALFTRENLSYMYEDKNKPDSVIERSFFSWVKLPETVNMPESIVIGKRNSAGHGLTDVAVKTDSKFNFREGSSKRPESCCLVQFLSPAIIRGENGFPLRSLDSNAWGKILDMDIIVASAQSSNRYVPGWMSTWKHGRAEVATIEAGSVWKLVPGDGNSIETLRKKIDDLEEKGLGERTHEGFGWVAVDPEWLVRTPNFTITDGKCELWPQAHEDAQVKPWPGFTENQDVKTLENIAAEARELGDISTELSGPLKVLSGMAREDEKVVSTANILQFADLRLSPEKKDHGKWKHYPTIKNFLKKYEDNRNLFRFAIEVLLIRVGKEKQA